jgi:hypothetical protein
MRRLCIWQSVREAFDHARHHLVATIRTLDPLKGAMSAVLPENVTLGLTCTVAAVMDAVTKRLSEITGTYALVVSCRNGMRESLRPATTNVKGVVVASR